MADKEQRKKPSVGENLPPDESIRRMVREEIEEQRQLIEKLRRKMN